MTEKPTIQISLTAEQKAQIQRQTGKQIRKLKLEVLEPRLAPGRSPN